MGFSDILAKGWELAQKGREMIQEKYDHINEIKSRLEECDDDELVHIYRSATGDKKIAAGLLLKDRGYGKNQE